MQAETCSYTAWLHLS